MLEHDHDLKHEGRPAISGVGGSLLLIYQLVMAGWSSWVKKNIGNYQLLSKKNLSLHIETHSHSQYYRTMRKILTMLLMLAPVAMLAQVKLATVDVQAVFNAMPESKVATEQLNAASAQLKAEYEMMQDEFNKKYAAYQQIALDAGTPQTIKDRRVREIQEGDRDIEKFLAKSKESLETQKQALEAPIYDRINRAIKLVGDEGGYTYIIDVSRTPVAYSGTGAIDLTQAVIGRCATLR